jgi:hypothetical protein
MAGWPCPSPQWHHLWRSPQSGRDSRGHRRSSPDGRPARWRSELRWSCHHGVGTSSHAWPALVGGGNDRPTFPTCTVRTVRPCLRTLCPASLGPTLAGIPWAAAAGGDIIGCGRRQGRGTTRPGRARKREHDALKIGAETHPFVVGEAVEPAEQLCQAHHSCGGKARLAKGQLRRKPSAEPVGLPIFVFFVTKKCYKLSR